MPTGLEATAAGREVDPVTFEIIRHRLWAINDDQARMGARLSGSFIVYDGYDFNSGLVTPDGQGLCCGVYILHHGATIDFFVRRILEEWPQDQIRDGDMFFTNDPWWGALHANDGIVAMPVFHDGEIVLWSGIVMHDNDVGSPVPGSFVTGAEDRFGEAPLFPGIRIAENFEPLVDVERAYLRNSRTPELNALNMRARVAALRVTHDRILEVVEEYGRDTFLRVQDGIVSYVDRVVRARLRGLPDGSWSSAGYLDHDGNTNADYPICCAVQKQGDRLTFDFTGTAPQVKGPINCAYPALEGVVMGVLLTLLCHDLPWSTGGLKGFVDIVSEPGTLNNATSPAAVSMASITGGLSTQDVVLQAFSKLLLCSDQYRAEATTSWTPGIGDSLIIAEAGGGEPQIGYVVDCFGGGGGARTFTDGIDSGGIFHSMASRVANVETVESAVPTLQLWRRELRDGGGAGRYRGGVPIEFAGMPYKLPTESAGFSNLCSGVAMPGGRGISGGVPGAPVRAMILRGSNVRELLASGQIPVGAEQIKMIEAELPEAKSYSIIGPDDLIVGSPAGGGGYGDPLRRDAARVAFDFQSGYVSENVARESYGVVLRSGVVQVEETEALRQRFRDERLSESKPGRHQGDHTAIDGTLELQVSDSLELIQHETGSLFRCSVCHSAFGDKSDDPKSHAVTRDRPLDSSGPLFDQCSPNYILREYYCPECATCIAVDVQEPGDDPLPEMRLA